MTVKTKILLINQQMLPTDPVKRKRMRFANGYSPHIYAMDPLEQVTMGRTSRPET